MAYFNWDHRQAFSKTVEKHAYYTRGSDNAEITQHNCQCITTCTSIAEERKCKWKTGVGFHHQLILILALVELVLRNTGSGWK